MILSFKRKSYLEDIYCSNSVKVLLCNDIFANFVLILDTYVTMRIYETRDLEETKKDTVSRRQETETETERAKENK